MVPGSLAQRRGRAQDLGLYDVSTLFDLFDPVRVDVRDGWLGRAITAADPADVVFDVEGWLTLELWHPEPREPFSDTVAAARESAGRLRTRAADPGR